MRSSRLSQARIACVALCRLLLASPLLLNDASVGAGGHVLVWAPPERHPGIAEAIRAEVGCTVRKPAIGAPGVRIEAGLA